MFIDGRGIESGSRLNADVCVIGAGPVGLAFALQYANQSRLKVLVLESGGLGFEEDIQNLADAEVIGHAVLNLRESRIRQFGGTSWSWGGILNPLEPIDFEARDWVPNSGWPITFNDLTDFYEAALTICEVEDVTGFPDEIPGVLGESGDSVERVPVWLSPPTRFGRTYANVFRRSQFVDVVLHASVTRLLASDDGTRVESVTIAVKDSTTRFQVNAGVYVLAAGGIENARLLLVSRDVHRSGLGNTRDVVGRYFMEHPRKYDRIRLNSLKGSLDGFVSGAAGTLGFTRVRVSDRVQREQRLLNYNANLAFGYLGQDTDQWYAIRRLAIALRRPWKDSPFFQDAKGGRVGVHWSDIKTTLKRPDRSFLGALGAGLRPRGLRRFIEISSTVEQAPHRHNRVALSTERDALGMPKAVLHWSIGDEEERAYRKGLDLMIDFLDERVPGSKASHVRDSEWPEGVDGTWHHMGTTRIHDNPNLGVVDSNCRVHDVANLYIAGSSVFPTGGSGSPTITAIALGIRLAGHIRSRLGTAC